MLLRAVVALALASCLGPGPAAARAASLPGWTHARDLLARLFSPAEPCELGGEVVGGRVEPGARTVIVPVKKKAWEASLGGEVAARPYIAARLAGWPEHLLVNRDALPRPDAEFVARLARDTWRGLEAFVDREHQLPVDNVRLGETSVDRSAARVGDYTNVTSVGLRLITIVAADELGLLSERDAVERIRMLLDTLGQLESYDGFFFNYYDTTSLERTSNFISFVDSSWLTAGLMVVRATFPQLRDRCSELIARGDYRFFYDARLQRMSHGYWVHLAERSRYHYGVLYAESRLGSLIAIGKGDVPEEHWFHMVRTFPPACRWQTQQPRARTRKTVHGHALVGGYYEWKGERYVPSWGGSMFEALMPTLVVDELHHAPRSLGANDVAHVAIHRRYALEELGYPVWGLSPSSTPANDGYGEYGVRPLGALGYGAGAVTPHAIALALGVAPAEAVAELRQLGVRYDAYGEYGLYDAIDPRTGQVAHAYLALDQAMIFIAAANYLKDDCIRRRFAADPIAQRAFAVIGEESFFD